jgi:LuxR family transcriptional regulator, maltose regulon positive regulatory protein
MLDETDARVLLLLAPAGYGKTTLARQWVKTLNGAIWLGARSAHGDIATLSEEIAASAGHPRFIQEFLRARSNPQREARKIGAALASELGKLRTQWLVVDDYHALEESPAVADFMVALHERSACRFLIASRTRPSWISTRDVLYGDVLEIGRDELAMTPEEADTLLGRQPARRQITTQAQGWPAVLALAVSLEAAQPPLGALPIALHRYLAEELFNSVSTELRHALLDLALSGSEPHALPASRHPQWSSLMRQAELLGFVSDQSKADLHPLLREFLLTKLLEENDARNRIDDAIERSIRAGDWDTALELVLRFTLLDRVEPILEQAFKPLTRGGRIGSLSRFAAQVRLAPTFPPPVVDLAEAEVAMRDGQLELALDLATRASARFPEGHALASRASAITGHASFLLASFANGERAFEAALDQAKDDRDETEALHGLTLVRTFGELPRVDEPLRALSRRRHVSPTDLVRYVTAELSRRHFAEGIAGNLGLEEALHALPLVEDPRARTALTYKAAYAFAQRSEYEEAETWLGRFFEDAAAYDLEFALPYANWASALIRLGLRRFGEAERSIKEVEQAADRGRDQGHSINARALRARLLLETGQADEALQRVSTEPEFPLIPSWRAEYVATRALAHACLSQSDKAMSAADEADATSAAGEVRVLVAAARAVVAAKNGGSVVTVIEIASRLGIWDPVVCALRASRDLADALAASQARRDLETLYERSQDHALARRAGFRTPTRRDPDKVLSPREQEVLALVARGLRNHEIAAALYIAPSTTKVHVRHVLEKLGARNRAEAAARYESGEDGG